MLEKVNVRNTDYQMKLVPGMKTEGKLDPKAKAELEHSIQQTNTGDFGSSTNDEADINTIRKGMGWKAANHTCEHKLSIKNENFAGVNVRVYVQEALQQTTLPTIIFMHGGGFFGGSLDNVEYPCQTLADLGTVRVVSVDYGLAPEHPYPADLIDCYHVLNYLAMNKAKLHVSSLITMGDSAGGNLTYTVSLLDRQLGTNFVDKAVSLYPVVYLGKDTERRAKFDDPEPLIADEDPAEIRAYVGNFNGNPGAIDDWYVRDADPESMYLSPLNAPEDLLQKMPQTLFMVGEFDPLRIQGEAFYNKMKLAGGDITYLRYNGMTHAFMDKVGDFVQADDCLVEALNFILG